MQTSGGFFVQFINVVEGKLLYLHKKIELLIHTCTPTPVDSIPNPADHFDIPLIRIQLIISHNIPTQF